VNHILCGTWLGRIYSADQRSDSPGRYTVGGLTCFVKCTFKLITQCMLWTGPRVKRCPGAPLTRSTLPAEQVEAEKIALGTAKREMERELASLKQAARAAMLELANQRQRTELEVRGGVIY
jgi:hypothetical protein